MMTLEQTHGYLHELGDRVPMRLVQFGRALEKAYEGGEPLEWWYFLEKPHKWSAEYVAWEANGYPSPGDDGWAAFLEAIPEA